MKPPIKELEKVIKYYECIEKEYEIKMNVTKPFLKHILKEFKYSKKLNKQLNK